MILTDILRLRINVRDFEHMKESDVKDRLCKVGAYYSYIRPDGTEKISFCKNMKDMLINVQIYFPSATIEDIKCLGLNKVTE